MQRVSRLARRATNRHTISRFGKFGAVGAGGVAINMAVFWLLTNSLNLHYLLAGPIAIELAMLSNYLLNNNWTFADRRRGLMSRASLARYHAVSLGGMGINLAALHMLAGAVGVPLLLANLIGIGVATFWNFALNGLWTWRRGTPASMAATS